MDAKKSDKKAKKSTAVIGAFIIFYALSTGLISASVLHLKVRG